jgi:hypothetical protein
MTPARPELRAGDVLLYRGDGFFSWAIRLRTWHLERNAPVHVEVSLGPAGAVASRNGLGVARYPTRYDGLAYVLRPTVPFDVLRALDWFTREANGARYGWLELLAFYGLDVRAGGWFCSEFATEFLREGGVRVFNDEPAIKIAPVTFLLSELLQVVWSLDAAPAAAQG